MGRFWSLLFLSVPILGTLAFVFAIAGVGPFRDHWLPENVNDYGGVVDQLFMFILYLTGVIFIGTGVALFWFMWKYDAAKNAQPPVYMHGSHALEIVWSVLPAATLLFIAIYQMNAWADQKMRRPVAEAGPDGIEGTDDDVLKAPIVEVTGRQFEWRIRYAGKDNVIGTPDDVHQVNDLHLPVDEDVVIQIKSMDVLHSFFLPHVRVKQDVVPGMKQFVWFHGNKPGIYDIVCAELCGWGHYKMRGKMTLESREKFDAWLAGQYAEQERSGFQPKTGATEND
ncbi:MAG: cytochrome c oxidase subunit II [Planctomycetota bacterium]